MDRVDVINVHKERSVKVVSVEELLTFSEVLVNVWTRWMSLVHSKEWSVRRVAKCYRPSS